MTNENNQVAPRSFWQRRVVDLIVSQLKQGITAEKIALTIALGITLGLFPILGTTSVLCGIAGVWCKLNQPIIQFVNWLMSAAQLAMILVFVRIGEWIVRADKVSFSIPEMFRTFHESPKKFMQEFGMTGLHGIIGWIAVAPFLAAAIYFGVLPAMRKMSNLYKAIPAHAE